MKPIKVHLTVALADFKSTTQDVIAVQYAYVAENCFVITLLFLIM